MIFFRNAMTSYYDLFRDEGQYSFGGLRPSCFINVLPVGGIVLAPTTFSGCQCNTLLRTSLALEPIEQDERWAIFCGDEPQEGTFHQLRLNFGALGDRRDAEGRLWFAYPRPPGYFAYHRSDTKTVKLENVVRFCGLQPTFHFKYDMAAALREEAGIDVHRVNTDSTPMFGSETPPWVAASCCRGPIQLEINTRGMNPGTVYRVRLHFAELEDVQVGERKLDVVVGEKTVLEGIDIVRDAGRRNTSLVREAEAVAADGVVNVSVTARTGTPILNGLEILAETVAGARQ
jgi:hypothetical protein